MSKTTSLLKMAFPRRLWRIKTHNKALYLTFDDGPTPELTDWTLDCLARYKAKATFFCIGKNVTQNPDLFERIKAENHQIGNHSYAHENGWKTDTPTYIDSIKKTDQVFKKHDLYTNLLRPPYGKMSQQQAKQLVDQGYKLIMWDVLSKDYDQNISEVECLQNAFRNLQKGSIIVFHDSVKAAKRMKYALPKFLEQCTNNGYTFKAIEQ